MTANTPTVEIFNIVHGSFVDGHGIRTTVFLKGCPLRCKWCCNPEGQETIKELKVTHSLCDGCGKCIEKCPESALRLDDAGILIADRANCSVCGKCEYYCTRDALGVFSRLYTPWELFDSVRNEKNYFRISGGGVTIGGGEPTMFPEFTYNFMKLCQNDGIHVAIDTCGYTGPEGFRILSEADLLLYDLKSMDDELHKKFTGVSNNLILKNLTALNDLGKEIIIRLPIIPGCSEFQDNIEATGEFLSGLKSVIRVDIMPYHEYGLIKYKLLGKEYEMDASKVTEERAQEIMETLRGYGLTVQSGG